MPAPSADPPDHAAHARLHASLARAGAVFVELCCGDAVAADHAVAATLQRLIAAPPASAHAFTLRYWQALLGTPRAAVGVHAGLSGPLAPLARLPRGLRELLLLQALSGLGVIELGAILKRSPASCQRALARAEALLPVASAPDWRTALAARVQALPTARSVNIATLRSADRSDFGQAGFGQAGDAAAPMATPARRWRAPAVVLALTALALAATWWLPGRRWGDDGEPRIRTRALAAAEVALRFDPAAAIDTDPDRALLEIGAADAAIAADTAFYAWYQAERLGTANYEPPPPTQEAPETAASAETGSHDAPP